MNTPQRLAGFAAALAMAIAACATNPVTGRRELALMSEAQEIELGRKSDAEIRKTMGVYGDEALQRYVQDIGLRLARTSERPNLPWTFAVVDSPAINAFAVPGGFIYLTRGILPFLDDEAELVGVLGHEVGHVTARHSVQQYSRQAAAGVGLGVLGILVPAVERATPIAEAGLGALFLKYGRDDEREADRLGVAYAAQNGWDPAGVAGMLTTLARLDEAAGERRGVPNWLSTHPAPADRVEEVQQFVAEARKTAAGTATNRDAFLARVDGLMFGDSPDKGVVRGGQFLHRELRFALRFPGGWEISNTDEQVSAKHPDANQIALLQLVPNAGSLEQSAAQHTAKAGLQAVDTARTRINGLDAIAGTYRGSVQGIGQVGVRAAHIMHGGRVYFVAGLAPSAQFAQAAGAFDETIASFRPLTEAEAAGIRGSRVTLYTARGGDSWSALAARAGDQAMRASTLAIMNDYEPAAAPRAGDRLKIVVPERN